MLTPYFFTGFRYLGSRSNVGEWFPEDNDARRWRD
jgi:hypothetical protein